MSAAPIQPNRLRLRGKFILAVTLLVLFITLLIVAFEIWSVRRTVVQQTITSGSTMANTIAATAGYYVIFDLTDDLNAMIADVSRNRDVEYADFVSADGVVLASTKGKTIPNALKRAPLTARPYDGVGDESGEQLYLFTRPFFESREEATQPNAKPRGFFRVAINESYVRSALNRILWTSLLITLLAIAISVVLAAAGSRFIVRPVLTVVESATQIAAGDLTRRTDVTTQDELGSLARAFNNMASNLEKTIAKVVNAQGKLNSVVETVGSRSGTVISSVDEQKQVLDHTYQSIDQLNSGIRKVSSNVEALSASSEETSSSILQMVASMEEVSRHTDSLFTSVEETASATTEMVSSISEVDHNVEYLQNFVTETSASMMQMGASINQVQANAARSYDLSLAVADAAESGMRAVRETIEGMEHIRGSVHNAHDVVLRLGERSQEIGKILTVIEDIAEQTNLLALNAAILAAQAGEYGRGFSVVAGEIRDLSERTQSSTRDISKLIRAVQEEVANATTSMNQGAGSVERGVDLAHDAGKALNRILDSATKSSEMGKEIAAATREQATGGEAVTRSIERLQDMVKQINGATRQQSAGSEHIMRAVDNMREVTRYVRQAMVEQRSGSQMISTAAERMIDMVHEIFEVTANQAAESETIVQTMERVREISEVNRRSAADMNDAIGSLADAIRTLDEEVRRFKIRA